mmetsp:Transcript_24210/g.60633  ORF Transcript_24210/g.60633 Transcript_24210/m.60633 type:complete len:269 (-) Transcript_24210:24-830(-)
MKLPGVDSLDDLSYRELQKLCSEANVSVPNRKKATLLSALRDHIVASAYEGGSEAGSDISSTTASSHPSDTERERETGTDTENSTKSVSSAAGESHKETGSKRRASEVAAASGTEDEQEGALLKRGKPARATPHAETEKELKSSSGASPPPAETQQQKAGAADTAKKAVVGVMAPPSSSVAQRSTAALRRVPTPFPVDPSSLERVGSSGHAVSPVKDMSMEMSVAPVQQQQYQQQQQQQQQQSLFQWQPQLQQPFYPPFQFPEVNYFN